MCPKHSEAKQTETMEFGTKKALLQGHKENAGLHTHTPKAQTPQRASVKHFSRQDEGVWWVLANFLVQEPFVLASIQGGQVMMFL